MQSPFRCLGCGNDVDAATRCPACGSTSFELARPILAAADHAVAAREREDRPTPITDAPSLRRRRAPRRTG